MPWENVMLLSNLHTTPPYSNRQIIIRQLMHVKTFPLLSFKRHSSIILVWSASSTITLFCYSFYKFKISYLLGPQDRTIVTHSTALQNRSGYCLKNQTIFIINTSHILTQSPVNRAHSILSVRFSTSVNLYFFISFNKMNTVYTRWESSLTLQTT